MKKLNSVFAGIFVFLSVMSLPLNVKADDYGPGNGMGNNGGGNLDPTTGRPRTDPGWITVYCEDGEMWFDFSTNITGFNVTATHTTTGTTVIEYVGDNTPIAVPFTTGSIYIVCITDDGTTFTGTVNL